MITHKFERAGLGKAPFRYVGHSTEIYQAIPGDPNCPIQPGASCHYCGTGISDVYYIESADGKRSKIGSTCISKVGDAGLVKHVKRAKRKAQILREHARIKTARENLPIIESALRTKHHPYPHLAKCGLTSFSFATWMLEHAGHSGQMKAARMIEKTLKERTTP